MDEHERRIRQEAYRAGVRYGIHTVRGYMCKVDFEHHLGQDPAGTMIYADIEDLKELRPCVDECGIVEVEVRLVEVHQWQNFGGGSEIAGGISLPDLDEDKAANVR